MGILQKKTLEKFHEFEFGIQDNDSEPQWYRFSNLLPGKSKFLNHSGSLVVLGSPRNHFRNFFFGGWVGGKATHPPTKRVLGGHTGGSLVVLRWYHQCHLGTTFEIVFQWVGGWKTTDPTTNSALGHPPANQQCGGRWHQWFCGGSGVTSSM